MSTVAQIIDYTIMQLSGFSAQQDQSTPITASISSTDTSVAVLDISQLSRGMAEIDSEIVFIESVNPTTNTALISRGFRSTPAVAHTAPARVVMSPLYYRAAVFQALNEAIGSTYPSLFGVSTTTFSVNGLQNTYVLPTGAKDVLECKWQNVGPTREWSMIRRWKCDNNANTTQFPSGTSLSVWDYIPSGRTVQVVYTFAPLKFTSETQDFSACGLPDTCEDVIRLGASWRLLTFIEAPHYAGLTAEADFAANNRPNGSAGNMARLLMGQYQSRLAEEAGRLNSLYSIRIHYTR